MAGGGRHTSDNFLHGGFFHTRDNSADDVLALRANLYVDWNGIWIGGNYGRNLRGDSGEFRSTDLANGRRGIIGLLLRR